MKPCVRELDGLDVGPVSKWLEACTTPLAPSQLYHSQLEVKLIDESIRRSSFRALTDPALFELCEPFVRRASAEDPTLDYMLLRNDATHIVYRPGDFFAKHTDYLSLKSNVVQEFTLIVSLNLPDPTAATAPTTSTSCEGGETIVYINSSANITSSATSTPGRALLFRKDLPHEGRPLISGIKHILSLNLWATAKHSPQVLLVTFPKPADAPAAAASAAAGQSEGGHDGREEGAAKVGQKRAGKQADSGRQQRTVPLTRRGRADAAAAAASGAGSGSATGEQAADAAAGEATEAAGTSASMAAALPAAVTATAALLHDAEASASYAIPTLSLLPNCFLARLVQFKTQQQQQQQQAGGAPPAVIHYEADNATDEQFGTVYRVLSRMYVTAEEVQANAALLDFHQIVTHHLLIDEANKDFGGAGEAAPAAAAAAAGAAPGSSKGKGSASGEKGAAKGKEGGKEAGEEAAAAPMRRRPGTAVPLSDSEIIICSSEERARVVASLAKAHALPYLPFRVLLMEGTITYGGEMADRPPAHLDMLPVFVSLGDYDNVYGIRRVVHKQCKYPLLKFEDHPLESYLSKGSATLVSPSEPSTLCQRHLPAPLPVETAALLTRPGARLALFGTYEDDAKPSDIARPAPPDSFPLPYRYEWEINHSWTVGLGLKAALATAGVPGAAPPDGGRLLQLLPTVMSAVCGGEGKLLGDLVVLPQAGGAQEGQVGAGAAPSGSSCFHYDADSKACFTAEEAARASARVAAVDLPGLVRGRVATTSFQLPQEHNVVDHHFCNESVYGKMGVVMVSGLIHMP